MKQLFDKWDKERTFQPNDLVLKWEKRREEHGKQGKFDIVWCRPFIIDKNEGENAFSLKNIQEESLGAPVNECFLKHFMIYWNFLKYHCTYHQINILLKQKIQNTKYE
jgi:hypothetical protein